MGCWNGTCAITQLPIKNKDEIVLIPLLSKGYELINGLTYNATDKYIPLCLPIYGKYNDYGGIEDIEHNKENEEFIKSLEFFKIAEDEELTEEKLINAFKSCSIKSISEVNRKLTENYKLDKIEEKPFEEFINDFVYNDGYYLKNGKKRPRYQDTNYIMVHKGIFDKLVKEMSSRIPYKKDKNIRQLWKEKIISEINNKKEILSIEDEQLRDAKIWPYELETLAKKLNLVEFNSDSFCYEYFFNKIMENYNDEILESVLDLIMFTNALALLRKGYLCISGLGSQSDEIYMHLLIADFIKEYAKNRIKEHDEEWIREDDFSEKDFLSETAWWWDR